MHVQVLFFGATADITGRRRVEIDFPIHTKVSDVFEKLVTHHPMLADHRILFSINQEYVSGNKILTDGDELAIFTAVSGG